MFLADLLFQNERGSRAGCTTAVAFAVESSVEVEKIVERWSSNISSNRATKRESGVRAMVSDSEVKLETRTRRVRKRQLGQANYQMSNLQRRLSDPSSP